MIFARLSVLIATTFVALLPGGGGLAAEQNPAELRIEIFGFGGFHVLTNRTKLLVSGDRYRIDMDLDTRNIAALFVDLSSHSEVHGRLVGDAVYPDAYLGDVRRNGTERLYRIDYGKDGTVASDQAPSSPAPRASAAVGQMRGTVDQLTAFFILERQLAQHGTCALVIRVFDGLALYNLRFTNSQPGTLPTDGRQRFDGRTQACDVNREDVAGFPGNGDLAAGTYSEGKIWYALNLVSGRIVPVRMRFETEFGRVEGYLAELRDNGVDYQFMN